MPHQDQGRFGAAPSIGEVVGIVGRFAAADVYGAGRLVSCGRVPDIRGRRYTNRRATDRGQRPRCGMSARGCPGVGGRGPATAVNENTSWQCWPDCRSVRCSRRMPASSELRSTTPHNAQLELDWSLAAIWAACLYAKHQQLQVGDDLTRTSVANVLCILRRAIHATSRMLPSLLARAVVDLYHRTNKTSRAYPRKKTRQSRNCPTTHPSTLCSQNKLKG